MAYRRGLQQASSNRLFCGACYERGSDGVDQVKSGTGSTCGDAADAGRAVVLLLTSGLTKP